jgi:hypothetical protein
MLKLVGDREVPSIEEFMKRYKVRDSFAVRFFA